CAFGRRARQASRQLRASPLAQPRLTQPVAEDLIPVAIEERVGVEERADVRREGELEQDVAYVALGRQRTGDRERRSAREVRQRACGTDHDPVRPWLEIR